mmetsp:Transcript_69930/g.227644  ORF Transcript_69930/g.227644 Transcript_69930/m.227644 type:complete len:332 (+) Transcript_69930:36-1031(+)
MMLRSRGLVEALQPAVRKLRAQGLPLVRRVPPGKELGEGDVARLRLVHCHHRLVELGVVQREAQFLGRRLDARARQGTLLLRIDPVEDLPDVGRAGVAHGRPLFVGRRTREVLLQQPVCLLELLPAPLLAPAQAIAHELYDARQRQARRRRVQKGQPRAPRQDVHRAHGVLLVHRVEHLGLQVWVAGRRRGTLVEPRVVLVEARTRAFHTPFRRIAQHLGGPSAVVAHEVLRHVVGDVEVLRELDRQGLVPTLGEELSLARSKQRGLQALGRPCLSSELLVVFHTLVNGVFRHLSPSGPLASRDEGDAVLRVVRHHVVPRGRALIRRVWVD